MAIIRDKDGREYSVQSVGDEMFNVLYDGDVVGHAYCNFYDCDVKIEDFFIESAVPRARRKLFGGAKFVEEDFRRNGLGGALLNFLCQHYGERGMKRIFGEIKESDFREQPFLPRFYRKHGFSVPESGVGPISKDLK